MLVVARGRRVPRLPGAVQRETGAVGDSGQRPERRMERGARALKRSPGCAMRWCMDVHVPIGASCGVWRWAQRVGRVHSRTGHQKATKSYLDSFSQDKASDVRSDLVCWCFSQVLLQRHSCDTCRILSLICSNAQAAPPPCKGLLKIYELFPVNSTSFGFSRICNAQ